MMLRVDGHGVNFKPWDYFYGLRQVYIVISQDIGHVHLLLFQLLLPASYQILPAVQKLRFTDLVLNQAPV